MGLQYLNVGTSMTSNDRRMCIENKDSYLPVVLLFFFLFLLLSIQMTISTRVCNFAFFESIKKLLSSEEYAFSEVRGKKSFSLLFFSTCYLVSCLEDLRTIIIWFCYCCSLIKTDVKQHLPLVSSSFDWYAIKIQTVVINILEEDKTR